jgi:hypothetical protein
MLLAQPEQAPQWLNHVLAFVPWLIIFLFIWAFVFHSLRKKQREDSALQEIQARLALLEQKLDQLLNERNR